jgi:hypothetical protein
LVCGLRRQIAFRFEGDCRANFRSTCAAIVGIGSSLLSSSLCPSWGTALGRSSGRSSGKVLVVLSPLYWTTVYLHTSCVGWIWPSESAAKMYLGPFFGYGGPGAASISTSSINPHALDRGRALGFGSHKVRRRTLMCHPCFSAMSARHRCQKTNGSMWCWRVQSREN